MNPSRFYSKIVKTRMNPGPCPCLGSVWKFLHGTRLFIWSVLDPVQFPCSVNISLVLHALFHARNNDYIQRHAFWEFRLFMQFSHKEIFHKNMQLVCHACNAIGWMCADVQFKMVGYSNWKTSHVPNLKSIFKNFLRHKIFNKYIWYQ